MSCDCGEQVQDMSSLEFPSHELTSCCVQVQLDELQISFHNNKTKKCEKVMRLNWRSCWNEFERVNSLESLRLKHSGWISNRNKCRISSLPLICTTTSACCPMIHSCWIIDALFIDLWRAPSERPGPVSPRCSFIRRSFIGSSAASVSSLPPVFLPSTHFFPAASDLVFFSLPLLVFTPEFLLFVFAGFFPLTPVQSSELSVNSICLLSVLSQGKCLFLQTNTEFCYQPFLLWE